MHARRALCGGACTPRVAAYAYSVAQSPYVVSRRNLIGGSALVLEAALGCRSSDVAHTALETDSPDLQTETRSPKGYLMTERLPTVYVPHGGGPWPFVSLPGQSPAETLELRTYLSGLPQTLPSTPRAVLVVSAHWEEKVPTVQTSAKPPLLYDYYGFPEAAYEVQWPAPGAPAVAKEVRAALEQAGIPSAEDNTRGFDHGTFVVTKVMYPDPSIPTFQLSLTADLDPRRLLAMGRALAPLRSRGVLILGSGMSYHNMRAFFAAMKGDPAPTNASRAFDDWLAETVTLEPSARETRLVEWALAPRARDCHPREEHLLPLMVCAGAALEDAGRTPYRDRFLGVQVLAAQFG